MAGDPASGRGGAKRRAGGGMAGAGGPASPDVEARRPPGRPRAADPMEAVTVRLPRSLVVVLDGAVRQRRQLDPAATRQEVLRDAVAAYLAPTRRGGRRP